MPPNQKSARAENREAPPPTPPTAPPSPKDAPTISSLPQKPTAAMTHPAQPHSLPAPKRTPSKATPKKPSTQQKGITLLTPGKGPKKQYAYTFGKAGTVHKTRTVTKMAMAISVNNQKANPTALPTTVATITLTHKKRRPDGTLEYELFINNLEITSTPKGLSKTQLDSFKGRLKNLKGLKGHGTLSKHGAQGTLTITPPPKADPFVVHQLQQMIDQLRQAPLELPKEKIGVGAKWYVYRILKPQGITVRARFTYELTKIEGNTLTVSMTVSHRAKPQRIHSPQLPQKMIQRLRSMKGSGSGTFTLDLSNPFPQSTFTSKVEMKTELSKKGEKKKLPMDVTVLITVLFSYIT